MQQLSNSGSSQYVAGKAVPDVGGNTRKYFLISGNFSRFDKIDTNLKSMRFQRPVCGSLVMAVASMAVAGGHYSLNLTKMNERKGAA